MSKRSINIEIKPRYRDEPFERVVRRFMKKVKKERIVENYRDRMYYEKPSMKRKRERARRKKVLEKLRWKRENTLNNY
jgi:ribosomal protein S21